jgi:polyisoprenoid-binding protein YceI
MKAHLRKIGYTIALLGAAAVSTAAIRPGPVLPESRIWVQGTSSVRAYSCTAAEVKGSLQAAAPTLDVTKLDGALREVAVVVEVAGLDCGNGTMNSHMRKALKSTDHREISFRLSDYTTVASGPETQVKMNGTLEIAGRALPVVVDGVASAAGDGAIRVTGSHAIRMSAFGVKAPSLMMGTMKVHDPVKLNFDVVLKP